MSTALRRRPSHLLLLAVALAATLAGCALSPPPTNAELQREALPNTVVPPAWNGGGGAAAPVADRWLASFNEPALSVLVEEAMRYNADLQATAALVEKAGAYLKIASASLLPAVTLAGSGSAANTSGSGGLNGLWLNASLELDIWGRVRYGEAEASANAQAVAASYAYARQSLAAMVAKGWFLAIEAGLQRGLALQAVASAESMLRLAQERLRVGVGTEQDVAAAGASLGSYRDQLRQAELARENALRAIELLLGRYPSAELAVAQNLPAMPGPVPMGLPSALLERRPDVVAAERQVAAAFNRVGGARAAQLPRISLTAGVSSISSDVVVLQNRDNPVWGLGGSLLAPLYQGGALRAQVEAASADQKQAVARFASVGQKAFGDVEAALAAENALRDRVTILEATVRDNERALELAKVQYRVGSTDLRTVEQRQLALQAARTSQLRVQTDRLAQRVNLYLALGGGFDEAPLAQLAAQ